MAQFDRIVNRILREAKTLDVERIARQLHEDLQDNAELKIEEAEEMGEEDKAEFIERVMDTVDEKIIKNFILDKIKTGLLETVRSRTSQSLPEEFTTEDQLRTEVRDILQIVLRQSRENAEGFFTGILNGNVNRLISLGDMQEIVDIRAGGGVVANEAIREYNRRFGTNLKKAEYFGKLILPPLFAGAYSYLFAGKKDASEDSGEYHHAPYHNYNGPGTKIEDRLTLGTRKNGKFPYFIPADIQDLIAFKHDLLYASDDRFIQTFADIEYLRDLNNVKKFQKEVNSKVLSGKKLIGNKAVKKTVDALKKAGSVEFLSDKAIWYQALARARGKSPAAFILEMPKLIRTAKKGGVSAVNEIFKWDIPTLFQLLNPSGTYNPSVDTNDKNIQDFIEEVNDVTKSMYNLMSDIGDFDTDGFFEVNNIINQDKFKSDLEGLYENFNLMIDIQEKIDGKQGYRKLELPSNDKFNDFFNTLKFELPYEPLEIIPNDVFDQHYLKTLNNPDTFGKLLKLTLQDQDTAKNKLDEIEDLLETQRIFPSNTPPIDTSTPSRPVPRLSGDAMIEAEIPVTPSETILSSINIEDMTVSSLTQYVSDPSLRTSMFQTDLTQINKLLPAGQKIRPPREDFDNLSGDKMDRLWNTWFDQALKTLQDSGQSIAPLLAVEDASDTRANNQITAQGGVKDPRDIQKIIRQEKAEKARFDQLDASVSHETIPPVESSADVRARAAFLGTGQQQLSETAQQKQARLASEAAQRKAQERADKASEAAQAARDVKGATGATEPAPAAAQPSKFHGIREALKMMKDGENIGETQLQEAKAAANRIKNDNTSSDDDKRIANIALSAINEFDAASEGGFGVDLDSMESAFESVKQKTEAAPAAPTAPADVAAPAAAAAPVPRPPIKRPEASIEAPFTTEAIEVKRQKELTAEERKAARAREDVDVSPPIAKEATGNKNNPDNLVDVINATDDVIDKILKPTPSQVRRKRAGLINFLTPDDQWGGIGSKHSNVLVRQDINRWNDTRKGKLTDNLDNTRLLNTEHLKMQSKYRPPAIRKDLEYKFNNTLISGRVPENVRRLRRNNPARMPPQHQTRFERRDFQPSINPPSNYAPVRSIYEPFYVPYIAVPSPRMAEKYYSNPNEFLDDNMYQKNRVRGIRGEPFRVVN